MLKPMKNAFIAALLFATVVAPFAASAQTTIAQPIAACAPYLTYNLYYGLNDRLTGGQVSRLQTFLQNQGYFPYAAVGVFGPVTYAAVRNFQIAHNIYPVTGGVGPITRSVIQQISCGGTPTPVPTGVSIYSVSPVQGPIGTTITITGSGFTNDNTIMFDGMTAVRGVSAINGRLTFVVPEYLQPYCPPGAYCLLYVVQTMQRAYQLTVQNTNGTSNATTFTVGSGAQNQPLSIIGLDAPAQVPVGSTATWTVHVSTTGSNLHYSVVWGDEYQTGTSFAAPSSTQVQTTATFSHAYRQSGTYTPTFTVTDDQGRSVSTSATVTVTPLY